MAQEKTQLDTLIDEISINTKRKFTFASLTMLMLSTNFRSEFETMQQDKCYIALRGTVSKAIVLFMGIIKEKRKEGRNTLVKTYADSLTISREKRRNRLITYKRLITEISQILKSYQESISEYPITMYGNGNREVTTRLPFQFYNFILDIRSCGLDLSSRSKVVEFYEGLLSDPEEISVSRQPNNNEVVFAFWAEFRGLGGKRLVKCIIDIMKPLPDRSVTFKIHGTEYHNAQPILPF